jgi:hypothetical protein
MAPSIGRAHMKVIVSGDKYMGNGSFVKIYEGELRDILVQIAHHHSYSQFDTETLADHGLKVEFMQTDDMLEEINMVNGDGCDYIVSMLVVTGDVTELKVNG